MENLLQEQKSNHDRLNKTILQQTTNKVMFH